MSKHYVVGNNGRNNRGHRKAQHAKRDEFGELIQMAMSQPKRIVQTFDCRVMASGYCLDHLEHHHWGW